jgi:putative transposase
VSRSGLYYEPVPTSAEELALMRRIDEIHLEHPFYGSRKLVVHAAPRGARRQSQARAAADARRWVSKSWRRSPRRASPIRNMWSTRILLRNLRISRPDQVWATDITYIPMKTGFVYLVAVMDWYSRRVLSWRLSNTLDSSFCIEALEEALERFGQPEIFNTDQGAQFTADAFTQVLRKRGVAISMDGKGRCLDNVFVERLWRSVKYEEVYLHAYDSVAEARAGIGRYLAFYNDERPHQALGYQTPDAFYRTARKAA